MNCIETTYTTGIPGFKPETVEISKLHPHPRNYHIHPEDQIEHIIESIKEHGFYRNIVVARDGTILAGHGVVEAMQRMGSTEIPVVRLNIDPNNPHALKILTGDNEVSHLNEVDDRLLSELLKEILDTDEDGLLGTGYDEQMLANLIYITRPASEIADFDAAAEWVGMPEYTEGQNVLKVIVSFRNEEDRMEFARILELKFTDKTKSTWWPVRERDDRVSVKFEG